MRIAIVGTGGVGAHYGACLIDAGEEVHLVATARHVQPIQRLGVIDTTDAGERALHPASVTTDPSDVGPVDAVIVATKLYQIRAATAAIGDLLHPDSIVLTLQNGVSAPQILADRVGAGRVVPGTTNIVAYLEGPGHVRQVGRPPVITTAARTLADGDDADVGEECDGRGVPDRPTDGRVARLADALSRGGVTVRIAEDIDRALWTKFALICTMGGVDTLAHATVGEVRSFPDTRALQQECLHEVQAVATARGITLTQGDLDAVLVQLDSVAPGSTTSMQRDLEKGHASELEDLNGDLVRLARESGVDVPLNRIVTAVLRLHAHRGHV